eukprot:826139-Alexandrium_andersonii.AAC.1
MRKVLSCLPDIDVEEHLRLLQRRPGGASAASSGTERAAPAAAVRTPQPPAAVLEEEYNRSTMRPPPQGTKLPEKSMQSEGGVIAAEAGADLPNTEN